MGHGLVRSRRRGGRGLRIGSDLAGSLRRVPPAPRLYEPSAVLNEMFENVRNSTK